MSKGRKTKSDSRTAQDFCSSHDIHRVYDNQPVTDATCILEGADGGQVTKRHCGSEFCLRSRRFISLSRHPPFFIKGASLHSWVNFILYCRNDNSRQCNGSCYIQNQSTSAYVTDFKPPLDADFAETVFLLQFFLERL